MIRLYTRLAGGALILAGVLVLIVLLTAFYGNFERKLSRLPDYDYIPDIRALMKEKKFGEARVLCEDVLAGETPERASVEILRALCDEELGSLRQRLLRAGKAFVTGDPGSSIEEAGAAVAADMVMYGDLRDLFLQGYYKVTGRETDWFIAAAAAAGLASEIVDAVDWAPACLKALRRTAAVSDTLGKSLVKNLKSRKTAVPLLKDLKEIYFKGGFLRTKKIVSTLSSAGDLKQAAVVVGHSPRTAHLIARSAGKKAPEVFAGLEHVRDAAFFKRLFLKGPPAVTLFIRGTKMLKKGTPGYLLEKAASEMLRTCGTGIFLLPLVLTGTGLLLCFTPFRKKPSA
ncbi:MAG: hypothetical protein IKC65_04515 [Lentisphaeria bacterium]|nr:hypothetical protein [Lentisphaeria bacterium]